MPTDQEIDATIESVRNSLKSQEELREQIAEYERAKEAFTKENGFPPEKLAADAKRVVEHILQNGTAEEKAGLERAQADFKVKLEAEMAQLDARAADAVRGQAAKAPRNRVRQMV